LRQFRTKNRIMAEERKRNGGMPSIGGGGLNRRPENLKIYLADERHHIDYPGWIRR